jgi:histidinol-phosphate aminotransferase
MTNAMSRRALMSAGAIATGALALPARGAFPSAEPPLIGPAPGVAQLSRNENPYGPAPSAVQAMAEWSAKGCYYADNALRRLSTIIAEHFALTPDHVMIGSGSTEILSAIALAYKGKGAILCNDLFWDTTAQYAQRQGAVLKRVPLGADMGVDLDTLAAAVTPDIGLVHICNPNNPTGMVLDGDKLRAFVKKVGPKVTVLVDEAYNELTDRPEYSSVVDLVKAGENVIVCRTFSKIYGMAGLRVGYALGAPEKVQPLASYMMSFGGNSAGLAAACASFNDTAFTRYSKAKVVEARGILVDAVAKAGLTALPSQTNFLFVKVADANAVQKAMAAKGILIRGAYGTWNQYSRVSTGRIEDVKRYAAALPEVIGA